MPIKKKKYTENYYTNKKYDSPEPNYESTDYYAISKFYSDYEFSMRLAHKINKSLKKKIGNTRGTIVLEELKKGNIKIRNEKTYLQYTYPHVDIGTVAWNYAVSPRKKKLEKNRVWCFIGEATRLMMQRLERGEDYIDLSSMLFYLAAAYKDLQKQRIYHKEMMEAFCSSLAGTMISGKENPFVINLFEAREAIKIAKELGLDIKSREHYAFVVNTLLKCLKYLKDSHKDFSFQPKVNLIVLMKKDPRPGQIRYLKEVLGLSTPVTSNAFKEFNQLGMINPSKALISKIEELKKVNNRGTVNTYRIVKKLRDIEVNTDIQTFPAVKIDIRHTFDGKYLDKELLEDFRFKIEYYYEDGMREAFLRHHAVVEIDGEKVMSVDDIKTTLGAAAEVLMTQVRHTLTKRHRAFDSPNLYLVILLKNLKNTKSEFVREVKKFEKKLISKYNKSFKILLNFQECAARTPYGSGIPEYVRVISDIHTDINDLQNYNFNFGHDFVINAGDTSGDVFTTRDWIRTFMYQGVSVTGNHLGYTDLGERAFMQTKEGKPFNIQPKNGQQRYLQTFFDGTFTPVLSNDVYEFEKMYIIGTTLYTDFKLFGEENQAACMMEAAKGMNDFKYCKYYNIETGQIEPFTVETHAHLFNVCLGYIRNRLAAFRRRNDKNSRYAVVIVTHHAPTPYSVAPQYKKDPLSAAFASDLRWLIDEYPEIRLWIHGHCVDDQTEVLTTNGWKTFNTIKQSDTLLNLNTYTNRIEKDKINAIISNNYSGQVYHFHSRGSDIRVTADHDMLIINREKQQYKKIAAKDLYTKLQKFIVRAGIQEKEGLNLSDDLLRLLVWISADGNRPKKTTKLVRFRLFKERKIKRLKELLARLGIQYRQYSYEGANSGCSINFELPNELEGYSFKPIDKRIINCNQHQCDIILEEYSHTDGMKNYKTFIVFTSKKEEADAIQLMCITNGYGCSITTRVNHGFALQSGENKVSYDLNISKKPYRCLDKPKNTVTVEEVQNEHFWCLNTNNGTLIIRRNGKVNITGNCHSPVDYIYKGCRFVCEPFGYYNENNFDVSKYGKRIKISDIVSKANWRNILRYKIETGKVQCYDE